MSDYVMLTDQKRSNIQDVIDQLTEVGEAIGEWTDKVDCRETGCSYYAKFDNKVPVSLSVKWAIQIANAPAMLADACRKLLAADAEIRRLGEVIDEYREAIQLHHADFRAVKQAVAKGLQCPTALDCASQVEWVRLALTEIDGIVR